MEGGGRRGEYAYLPDECWELIFHRLREEEDDDELDLASLSLVSKRFLSITNRLKIRLQVRHSTHGVLAKLVQRFGHLKIINIINHEDGLDNVVEIFSAGLNHLQVLELPRHSSPLPGGFWELGTNKMLLSLKTLYCWELSSLQDRDLIAIGDLFPSLEELVIDVDGNITDYGVDLLATKLKDSLKSITFHGSKNLSLTDQSLISLSSNCKNLREIHIHLITHKITENGVGFVMRHSPNLTSLSLGSVNKRNSDCSESLTIENSIQYARNLQALDLKDLSPQHVLWDQLVRSMNKAHPPPPLKKLKSLLYDSNQSGLMLLLQACHESLEELTLHEEYRISTDWFMSNLSQHLPPRLTYIELSHCSGLSPFRFYNLLRNCPLLGTIILNSTSGDATNNFATTDLHKNYQMRHLSAYNCNNWLNHVTLKKIGWVCPNLQILHVCGFMIPLKEGIGDIMISCSSTLRYLEISYLCEVSNVFRKEHSEQLTMVNLKTLKAAGTRINDEEMGMIGKRCPRLQCLDISRCLSITNKGVKEVVRNCKRLREISLRGCENVSADILFWMVLSWPSLKKIVPPPLVPPNKQLLDLFLCFGCKLFDGTL